MIAVVQAAHEGAVSPQAPNVDSGDNWLWYASWLIGGIVIGIILYSLIKHYFTSRTLKAPHRDTETEGLRQNNPKRQAWHQKITIETQETWW